jgi:hypothetical protein
MRALTNDSTNLQINMRRKHHTSTAKSISLTPIVGACLGSALLAGWPATNARAQGADAARVDKLEKENADLKKRLDALEAKEGMAPGKSYVVKATGDMTLSGFVTASYFYDTSVPGDNTSNGYLWNTSHNAFSLNKVKLTLASAPVERSGDTWDSAYRVSLIFGEDAPIVNTGGEAQGMESLREAYVELNAPIGTGLNIRVGQLISLLNYESGDGGAVNANFSQGYQWFYTGNGPAAGVQLGYTLSDVLDVKLRVQNGMYSGPFDGNSAKTVMGALGIKPDEKTWFSLIGFGGDEGNTLSLIGASLLAGRTFGENITTGLELDYFNFDRHAAGHSDLYSIGGWFSYDFNPKFGVAVRAEYLRDPDAFGIPGVPGGGFRGNPNTVIASTDPDGDLTSIALTLNIKPVPNVKIQPEIRFDNTSYKNGFDGQTSRFLVGMGISYLY